MAMFNTGWTLKALKLKLKKKKKKKSCYPLYKSVGSRPVFVFVGSTGSLNASHAACQNGSIHEVEDSN